MTDAEANVVIARYRDAIVKLNAYIAREPDLGRRDAARDLADKYRNKIIGTAWMCVAAGPDTLQALAADVEVLIANASGVQTVPGALAELQRFASSLRATHGVTP